MYVSVDDDWLVSEAITRFLSRLVNPWMSLAGVGICVLRVCLMVCGTVWEQTDC